MSGRSLRVQTRRPEQESSIENWNLFARLSPFAATSLGCQDAEFQALSVTFASGARIYVSYNGGGLAVEDEIAVVELPCTLIPEDEVYTEAAWVQLLPHVKVIPSLQVKPLTSADWELLESSVDFLEGGGLLQQVSLVFPNQVLSLWVGLGRDVAQVRVLLQDDHEASRTSLWPENEEDNRCWRIIADSQVCVIPNVRSGKASSAPMLNLRVFPVSKDLSDSMLSFAQMLDRSLRFVSVAPFEAKIHPSSTTSPLPELFLVENSNKAGPTQVVLVKESTHVPRNHVVLHPLNRMALESSFWARVTLKPLTLDQTSLSPDILKAMTSSGTAKVCLERLDPAPVDEKVWSYPEGYPTWKTASFLEDKVAPDPESPVGNGSLLRCAWLDPEYPDGFCRLSWDVADGSVDPHLFAPLRDLPELLCSTDSNLLINADTSTKPPVVPRLQRTLNMLPSIISTIDPMLSDIAGRKCLDHVVCGESGSGKTHTALVLAAMARMTRARCTLYLDCRKLKNSSTVRMKDILSELEAIVHDAVQFRPSIIILDDLDELVPNLEPQTLGSDDSAQVHQINPAAVDQAKLIVDTLEEMLEATTGSTSSPDLCDAVSVIATCVNLNSLSPLLQSARFFQRAVQVPTLDAEDRRSVLKELLRQKLSASNLDTEALDLGRRTEGFRPRDLEKFASQVGRCEAEMVIDDAVNHVLEDFTPRARLAASTEKTSSSSSWSDVGGLFQLKKDLSDAILHPVRFRSIYNKTSIRLPRGILLYGPPGCGKSFVVPALAKECGFPLISCRGPELLDRYIGASEAKVRDLFGRASAVAPSILFFDEIDSLAPRRGSDHTGVTDRVVNQLLTFLDGVEETSTIYVIAATSRPDKVDPALLRPGRLEKHIFVSLPTEAEWKDLFSKISSKWKTQPLSGEFFQDIRNIPHLFQLSPADLNAAMATAHTHAVHDYLANKDSGGELVIEARHLKMALKSTRPSLPPDETAKLQNIYRPFLPGGHAEPVEHLLTSLK